MQSLATAPTEQTDCLASPYHFGGKNSCKKGGGVAGLGGVSVKHEMDHHHHNQQHHHHNQQHHNQQHHQHHKTSFFSIHQKLKELYEEEVQLANPSSFLARQQQPLQYLRPSSFLLEKLVRRYKLNTLILKLFPEKKGYSMGYRMGGEHQFETPPRPYQEDLLLDYIDNEELPPMIAVQLESYPELYYSGCVIVEVQNYRRQTLRAVCDIQHVLLRPTTQSVLSDVNQMTEAGEWSAEERLSLESQVVLATQGPLCLDPSPRVGLVAERDHHSRNALNTPALRAAARRHNLAASNATAARKRKQPHSLTTTTPSSNLARFLANRATTPRKRPAIGQGLLSKGPAVTATATALLRHQALKQHHHHPRINAATTTIDTPPIATAASDIGNGSGGGNCLVRSEEVKDPRELARPLGWPPEGTNDFTPVLVEEHILETERGNNRIYHIKLSIYQRPANCECLGQLYVDKEYRDGELNGSTCRFSLGSRVQANRYIQQFKEIMTMEGRKSVKITHRIPGKPPEVSFTNDTMRDRERERESKLAAARQQLQQQQQQQVLLQMQLIQQQQVLKQQAKGESPPNNSILAGVTLNGLLSNGTAAPATQPPPPSAPVIAAIAASSSSATVIANGELATPAPANSQHQTTPFTQQTNKQLMTEDHAINAIAQDLENSFRQYQQQKAAAAIVNCGTTSDVSGGGGGSSNSVTRVAAAAVLNSSAATASILNSRGVNVNVGVSVGSVVNVSTGATTTFSLLNHHPHHHHHPTQHHQDPHSGHIVNHSVVLTQQQQQRTAAINSSNSNSGNSNSAVTGNSGRRLVHQTNSSTSTGGTPVQLVSALANRLTSPPNQKAAALIQRATTLRRNNHLDPVNPAASSGSSPTANYRLSGLLVGTSSADSPLPLSLPLHQMSANDSPSPSPSPSSSTLLDRLSASSPPFPPSSSPKSVVAAAASLAAASSQPSSNFTFNLQGNMLTAKQSPASSGLSNTATATLDAITAHNRLNCSSIHHQFQQAATGLGGGGGGAENNNGSSISMSGPSAASPHSPPQPHQINFISQINSIAGAQFQRAMIVPISVPLNNVSSSGHSVVQPGAAATLAGSMANASIATMAVSASNNPTATAAAMVFTNSATAQLLTAPNSKGGLLPNLRAATPAATNLLGGPSIQLVGTVQRPRAIVTTKQAPFNNPQATRTVINPNPPRHMLKVAAATATNTGGDLGVGHLSLQPLQKQIQQPAAAAAAKPRRRSTTLMTTQPANK